MRRAALARGRGCIAPVHQRKAVEIVRLRRRYLPLVAVLGVAVAVLPAVAASETAPSISAYDEPGFYGGHSWKPSMATVEAGGVVSFSNPYREVPHGLKFTGGPATPSCAGIPAAASEVSGATNWHGECTFSAVGTYTFICTVHPGEMKGTITVNPNGTTTTTITPTTTATTPTTTPVQPPSGPPLIGGPSIRASQHGGAIKGTLNISSSGAGDRLEVDIFAKGASLARVGHATRVRVGRLVRGSVPVGKLSFTVKLSAKARGALKRHTRLALTVRIVLTPAHGKPTTVSRSVVDHS
jgi:plastocyanin